MYGATLGYRRYNFSNLATLLAKASPLRSGDILAGIAAQSGEERAAAQFALADLPLRTFLEDHLIAYESDDITIGLRIHLPNVLKNPPTAISPTSEA